MCSPHIMTGNLKKNCSIPLKTFFKKTLKKKITAWNCENIISTSSLYKASKHTISMTCHGMYWSWLICRSISQDSPSSGFDRQEGSASFCRSEVGWVDLASHKFPLVQGQHTQTEFFSWSWQRQNKQNTQSVWRSRVETNNVSLPPHSTGENKSHGKHWPGWDHHMVWMKGVRNQG